MINPFDDFPTENLRLCKRNGEVIEDVETLFEPNMIHIRDTSLIIYEGDIFERVLLNGKAERYEVTQCDYIASMPEFMPTYDCKIRKLTGLHQPTKSATTTYNITATQVNVANDNAVIHATQYNGLYSEELKNIIEAVRKEQGLLSDKERVAAEESLEVIEAEAQSDKPKKSMINTALTTLKTVKGSIEFSAAVLTLAQFINSVLR